MSSTDFYQPSFGEAPGKPARDIAPELWAAGAVVRSVNWLGDAVMMLPALWAIRQLIPAQGRLVVVCPAKLGGFWHSVPWVDAVITMEGKRVLRPQAEAIRNLGVKVGVIFPNSFGAGLDFYLKGLPVRVGRGGRMRGFMLTHRLGAWRRQPGRDEHHQVREYLEIARRCGSDYWSSDFPAAAPVIKPGRLQELGSPLAGTARWLALVPGAAFGPAKQWPLEYHAELARRWMATGGRVLILGAPGEEAAGAQVAAGAPGSLNLVGRTAIPELMYLLGHAHAAVVNDSGAMHLAGAMGGRGVAIFGSTDPVATGPLGGRFVALKDDHSCSPCLRRVCPLENAEQHYRCLRSISVERVLGALESLS